MEVFETCRIISEALSSENHEKARNELIKLLDFHEKEDMEYSPLVNHLIREVGLYPYLQSDSASWKDRFVFEAFKVDVGLDKPITLHREQSGLLKKLLAGESLAISAPTSFGKSFVIDAFIAIKQPKNVVIVVPTLALTDETRRRIYSKFADVYKIITTSEVELSERNIFIFPQERALNYANKLKEIDILIIDEFYKASSKFDRERAPSLVKAIIKLGQISKQKYFLAPNISDLNENPFTKDMEFLHLDFNTVFLEKNNLYTKINGDEVKKSEYLVKILKSKPTKTLIYAGNYPNIEKVATLILTNFSAIESKLLNSFAKWLSKNYEVNWNLTNLVRRGTGIHNGNLHRSLSQIQIKLFEDQNGLNNIISTSSIIEGVNTSAENVIIWRNRNGNAKLNDFTYKNIIGRGGRMFKHFIGKIYILEKPPESEQTNLELTFPDEILGDVEYTNFEEDLTEDQLSKIVSFKQEMSAILGKENFARLQKENAFQSSNLDTIKTIALNLSEKQSDWNGLSYLNSVNPSQWDRFLFKAIELQPGAWDAPYRTFVEFVKILSNNWTQSIPEMLSNLEKYNVDLNAFFKLERNVTYKLATLMTDLNTLQSVILKQSSYDISPFVSKLSHAFLPSVVYQLEEYGLPRMISKKIFQSSIIDFENPDLTIHGVIGMFNKIGLKELRSKTKALDEFDTYILEYFFDGIKLKSKLLK